MIRAGLRSRIAAVAVGLFVPSLACACAVCFSGSPKVREAFFNMTVMMSLVPLALLFGGVWALRRASGIVPSEEFSVTDNSIPPPEAPASATSDAASGPVGVLAVLETAKRPGAA